MHLTLRLCCHNLRNCDAYEQQTSVSKSGRELRERKPARISCVSELCNQRKCTSVLDWDPFEEFCSPRTYCRCGRPIPFRSVDLEVRVCVGESPFLTVNVNYLSNLPCNSFLAGRVDLLSPFWCTKIFGIRYWRTTHESVFVFAPSLRSARS
jgi:hypothetical protein